MSVIVKISADYCATYYFGEDGDKFMVKGYGKLNLSEGLEDKVDKETLIELADDIILNQKYELIDYADRIEGLRSPKKDEEPLSIELKNVFIEQVVSYRSCTNENENGFYEEERYDHDGNCIIYEYNPDKYPEKAEYHWFEDEEENIKIYFEQKNYINLPFEFATPSDLTDYEEDEE